MAAVAQTQEITDGAWSVRDVARFLSVSEKTIWRWSEAGKLPKGKKLPGRAVRWSPDVIRRWFDKRPAA